MLAILTYDLRCKESAGNPNTKLTNPNLLFSFRARETHFSDLLDRKRRSVEVGLHCFVDWGS
jgi:hypothetical protein